MSEQDLFLTRPMIHAFGAKSRIVTRYVYPTPWTACKLLDVDGMHCTGMYSVLACLATQSLMQITQGTIYLCSSPSGC